MRNRYLFWLCGSYIIASFCSAVFESFLGVAALLLVFATVPVVSLCKLDARRTAALVVLGIAVSITWQSLFFANDKIDKSLLGKEVSLSATVTSFSEKTENGSTSFRTTAEHNGKRLRLMVYLLGEEKEFSPGDILNLTLKIYEYEDTEFFAQKTYYKSRHIDARAYASSAELVGREENAKLMYLPQYLAESVKEKISLLFDGESASFIKSLILGDTLDLGSDFKDDLRRSGLSHIVSVSGLHISFLMGFLIFFTKNKYIKLAAIPVMFCFAIMVGAPQSALRAVIMQTLVVLAGVRKREYDSLTALSFAAFVLVLINPYCVTDVGFLLSFSATLGIILLHPKLFSKLCIKKKDFPKWARKIINSLAATLSVTVSAILFTVPITAYEFNSFSLISPLSNVLLGFVIMVLFTGSVICVALSFISLTVAKGVAFLLNHLAEFVINTIKTISKLSFAEVFTGEPIMILAVCFFCLVAVFAILAGRKKVRRGFVALIAFVAIISFPVANFLFPQQEREGIRFDVLDVGQGQCIVATEGDLCVVIDCGGDKDADNIAISHLLKRRISDIDALILTHAHSDHANGAKYLTDTINTKAVYMPASDKDNATFIKLSETGEAVFVEEDTKLSFSDMEISILTLPEGKDENENGLVVVVSDDEYDLLITGDIPSKLEELIVPRIPDCESFVLGHHGSKTSSSQELINKALPELCVISVGEGNSYGHPNAETIQRIEKLGSEIHRTDLEGSLTFYSR